MQTPLSFSGRRDSLLPLVAGLDVDGLDVDDVAIDVGIVFSPPADGLDLAVAIDDGILFSARADGPGLDVAGQGWTIVVVIVRNAFKIYWAESVVFYQLLSSVSFNLFCLSFGQAAKAIVL
jgi:hypothetical protein